MSISEWQKEALGFYRWLTWQKPGCQSTVQAANQLLNFSAMLWFFQTGYCRRICCENLIEKPLLSKMPWLNLGLASCVWAQNNLVAKSRGFSPVKEWVVLNKLVAGGRRKKSLVTNSMFSSLVLKWILNKCCCCFEIVGWKATWNVSIILDQAAVHLSWLLSLLSAFLLFLIEPTLFIGKEDREPPTLAVFSVLPDFSWLWIQNNRLLVKNSGFIFLCSVWRFEGFFIYKIHTLTLQTCIFSANPYHIFGLQNK